MIKHNADVAYAYFNNIYEDKQKNNSSNIHEPYKDILVQGIDIIKLAFAPPTPLFVVAQKMYKKEIFDNLRFNLNKLHEDEFIYHKILSKTKKLVYTTKPLYNYLIRSNSIMNTRKDKSFLDFHDAYQHR